MSNIAPVLLYIALIMYSIILHEIAHGYAALRFGDPTAKYMDRLTLNPIPHVDLFGTIIFPVLQYLTAGTVFIGWAKPVPVQPGNFEPRVMGDIVVSVAGVAVNFAIAVLMAFILGFRPLAPAGSTLLIVLVGVMKTNLALMVFNLIPIPPLDGSHVMKYLLPAGIRRQYEQIGLYGTIILLLLIVQGALGPVIRPPIEFLYNLLLDHITLPLRGAA